MMETLSAILSALWTANSTSRQYRQLKHPVTGLVIHESILKIVFFLAKFPCTSTKFLKVYVSAKFRKSGRTWNYSS